MALFGSNLQNEVGLKLLLCPLGSNIVVRTACCTVGIVFPVYSTFKAIETRNQNEQERWLFYWAVYGSFTIAEAFADKVLCRFSLYYHLKFAFLVWLQLPSVDVGRRICYLLQELGSRQLYMNHLRPFLLKHQVRLDHIVGIVYGEMAKFVDAHQTEIQFGRSLIGKILGAASQIAMEEVDPAQPGPASESPRLQISEPDSNVHPVGNQEDGPIEETTSGSDSSNGE